MPENTLRWLPHHGRVGPSAPYDRSVSELEPSDLRISDTEREDAMRMLGEHMSVGRLDVDEYGERTANVAAAKTRRELVELFADLPEPRPTFGALVTSQPTQPATAPAQGPERWQDRPVLERLWPALVPLSAIIALILFFTLIKVWFIFLLPAAVAVIGGALWGDEDWKRGRRHIERRRYGRRSFEHRMQHRHRRLERGDEDRY
jgi:hypothetical protein